MLYIHAALQHVAEEKQHVAQWQGMLVLSGSHARRKRQEKRKEKRRAGSVNFTMNSHPAGSNLQHRLAQRMRGGARLRHLMRCHLTGSPHAHERTGSPSASRRPPLPAPTQPHLAAHKNTRTRRHWRTPVCSQSDKTAHSHTRARARYSPYIIRKHADVSPSSSGRSPLSGQLTH